MKFIKSLLSICLVAFLTVGCSRTQVVLEPSFEVTSSNQDVIKRAVQSALVSRGWSIINQGRGVVEAKYDRSVGQVARIAVRYVGNKVDIRLISSEGLFEERDESGLVVIHKNVNRWLRLLERDIQKQVVAFNTF